jgi:RNA polymerase sigma-70 factor, ECF subfamily
VQPNAGAGKLDLSGQTDAARNHAWLRDGAPSDLELLAGVRARDEAALVALYDRFAGLVLTVAMRVVGERELAEEIMQDTFLRCWNGAETYQPGRGQVSSWLMGIARNRAIDVLRSRHHRARQHERTSLDAWGDPGIPNAADEADAIANRQAVAAALNGLSTPQRQVVELAYYGGLSQSEIAAQLGQPLGTVKSRTRVAMDQLRTALRPYFQPETDAPGRMDGDPS